MTRILGTAIAMVGLLACLAATAQVAAPPPPPTTDGTLTYTDPAAGTTTATYDYGATGWDPSLISLAGGSLVGGGLLLRGYLRKRA